MLQRLTKNWIDRLVFGFTSLFDGDGNELPKRSFIQFTGLSIVDDETQDRLIVGPAFPVVQEDLKLPLVLDKDRTILVEEWTSSRLVISPAFTGNLDGAQKAIIIEAEALDELIISPAFIVRGDFTVHPVTGVPTGWDPDKRTLLFFTQVGNVAYCVTTQYEPVEDGVPEVLSATVNGGAPSQLIVVWDSPVVVFARDTPGFEGFALTAGAGTQLDGSVSGNGTSTHTYTLFAPLAGDEVFDFVVSAARTAQSLYGPIVATGSVPVTLAFGPSDTVTGALHLWRGDSRTLSGSDVLTVLDQIGSRTMTAGATKPTTTTLGSLSAPAMQLTSGAHLTTGVIAAETMTSGSINIIFRVVSGGDRALVVGGNGTTFEALNYIAGGGTSLLAASDNAQTGGLSAAWSPGAGIHSICFTWDPSGREQYLDNVLHDSDTTDATTPTITKWVLGALLDLSTLSGGTIIIGEVQVGNQHLANGTEIHNIRASRYGT